MGRPLLICRVLQPTKTARQAMQTACLVESLPRSLLLKDAVTIVRNDLSKLCQ